MGSPQYMPPASFHRDLKPTGPASSAPLASEGPRVLPHVPSDATVRGGSDATKRRALLWVAAASLVGATALLGSATWLLLR